MTTQVARLLVLILALALLVNGGYERMILEQTSDAALSVALSALMINWYLDLRKQDKKI